MNKDVIYIDVEDDITTIIGKLKASKERIVALVPPRRAGVLQSAVNLRLLTKTAQAADKRIVLVTNDQVLAGLAATAKIPVAKTLQSRPAMAEMPLAVKVDDDDVIDGSQLPVGELAKAAHTPSRKDAAVAAVLADETQAADGTTRPKAADRKPTAKVPNFTVFRKKFLLIGGGVLLAVVVLVWAIWFAPRATVVITAKTASVTVGSTPTLVVGGDTNADASTLKVIKEEQSQQLSVDFAATGKKKVGEKARGKVRLSTDSIDMLDKTVPKDTTLTADDGSKFTTDAAVTFTLSNYRGITVGVTAADIGSEYNGASGRMSGAPSGVRAVLTDDTSGGSSREITVVSEADIINATNSLNAKTDASLKDKLISSFDKSAIVIKDSYMEHRSQPAASVSVGNEANGSVNLKSTLTTTMLAVDKAELRGYLKTLINKELTGKESQKIYKDGVDSSQFSQFTNHEGTYTARLSADAIVGPSIDEAAVKEQSKGRSYGDVQSALESIEGVQDVDVKFWPFWVRTVPGDTNRITIEFNLQNAAA